MAVRNALAADLTIGPAITGADGAVRIYADKLKQASTFPALTYKRVSVIRNERSGSYTHSGGNAGYTGRAWARISITIWSPEFRDTVTLGSAVIKLVHALDLTDSGQSMNKI